MFRIASKKLQSINMSQKLISTYFKSPQGEKRKKNEENNDHNPSKHFKETKEMELTNGHQGNTDFRHQILALSKKIPALSSNIGLTWFKALSKEFEKDYFIELSKFLKQERAKYTIYPPEKDVYSWTNAVKIHDVKVIILGQDPYHGPNQAHGLAFSVRKGVIPPPSLKNMYKELVNDIPGFTIPSHGFLYGWASQGVLLLNSTLTVRAGCPSSHSASKWSCLTDAVIRWIDENLPNSVFMLWGKHAQDKMALITKARHLVLTAPHPSPFSANRGFFGCHHFSKANDYLKDCGKKPIDWNYLP